MDCSCQDFWQIPPHGTIHAEDRGCGSCLFGFGEALHLLPEGDHGLPHVDGSVIIYYMRYILLVHASLYLLLRYRKIYEIHPEGRTRLQWPEAPESRSIPQH